MFGKQALRCPVSPTRSRFIGVCCFSVPKLVHHAPKKNISFPQKYKHVTAGLALYQLYVSSSPIYGMITPCITIYKL